MQGNPWYQILSDPKYSFEFSHIGAHVNEREKLIEDIWEDEQDEYDPRELSYDCKRVRYEQSDMVTVLLNLSFIPDDVVKFIDFQPGWQERFKTHMTAYKRYFEEIYERKWEFQNRSLEVEYSRFFHQRLKQDMDMIMKHIESS